MVRIFHKYRFRQVEEGMEVFFQEGNNMMLDISAPIIPFEGFGEIKLYSTRNEFTMF